MRKLVFVVLFLAMVFSLAGPVVALASNYHCEMAETYQKMGMTPAYYWEAALCIVFAALQEAGWWQE